MKQPIAFEVRGIETFTTADGLAFRMKSRVMISSGVKADRL